ncbi:MAG: peptidase S10, partial [Verrucomicrobia bacterium]|nr:peptidase S10 [Verrucomicrobiota bacterium]
MRTLLPLTLLLTLGISFSSAQDDKKADPKKKEEEKAAKDDKEQIVVKERSVTIAGKVINYTVTAAKLQLKNAKGDTRADMFHISYIRTGVDKPKDRPVVFAFNGGPGSSSVWLHLGALGPRLVPTSPDGTQPLTPP